MDEKKENNKEFDLAKFIKRYWNQNRPFFIFVLFVFTMVLMLSSFKYLLH